MAIGGISQNELVFLRLLERTKRLTKENLSQNVWKVTAAIKVLTNQLNQLEECGEENDMILEYRREIVQLGLLAEAEKQATIEESLKIMKKIEQKESAAGIREAQKSIYRQDLRHELLRNRKTHENHENFGNSDEIFMKNEKIEENLAEDLLKMTKSLKSVMSAAGEVIKEDNVRLSKMQQQVDKNKSDLEIESDRLAHHAYKCGFDCMRIFLVIFIFWTFISMVVMMKMFPKRVVS
ncbi:unnamed protein product [Caenorhabditis angaria]|uniref:Vesicle transport protein USE1 n=1 Tax=Caenorhabditis angaria TaxID=860376 RepID=A0A9P1I8P7_9PELO|nr:unnamed protein product [Caenorhabditis angaria]